jgi:UDP-glucose 4-epimerase
VLADAVARTVVDLQPVNLAFGSRVSLLEVIDELEGIMGHHLHRLHRDPRPGDVPHSQADSTRLSELFPMVRPRPLSECLRATVAWLRETN